MWNSAIWRKAWGDQRWPLLAIAVLWIAFPWIYLSLTSHMTNSNFQELLLRAIPKSWQKLSSVSFADIASPAGRVSLLFVDPVIMLTATSWAVVRGSGIVSGQIESGTLEMILTAPVRRSSVYVVEAVATLAGIAVLCTALLASSTLALMLTRHFEGVAPWRLIPPVVNLCGAMACIAAVASCLSAADSRRWRTVGLTCGFITASIIAKTVGRLSDPLAWIGSLSFLSAYDPQRLMAAGSGAYSLLGMQCWPLVALALAAHAIGLAIFCRRDLPALS